MQTLGERIRKKKAQERFAQMVSNVMSAKRNQARLKSLVRERSAKRKANLVSEKFRELASLERNRQRIRALREKKQQNALAQVKQTLTKAVKTVATRPPAPPTNFQLKRYDIAKKAQWRLKQQRPGVSHPAQELEEAERRREQEWRERVKQEWENQGLFKKVARRLRPVMTKWFASRGNTTKKPPRRRQFAKPFVAGLALASMFKGAGQGMYPGVGQYAGAGLARYGDGVTVMKPHNKHAGITKNQRSKALMRRNRPMKTKYVPPIPTIAVPPQATDVAKETNEALLYKLVGEL